MSALFRCPRSISFQLSPRLVTGGVRPFPLFLFICLPGLVHAAFLFNCPPGLSLVVSALFRCFHSFVSQVCHCSFLPFSVGHVAFLFICLPGQHFYSFVSQVCHCWCPPFSAGDATFLFICLPCLSLVVSALFRWRCNISIDLLQVCHCWCPPFSAGNAAFLFICLPGLSLLVSALFRPPCSISIH